MTHKYFSLTIIVMVLLLMLLVDCSSTPAEMTPTPDMSIIWSDDFEDGDKEGWMEDFAYQANNSFFVEEGVLNNDELSYGIIYHESEVSSGTWSFDLFYPEEPEIYVPSYRIAVICDQRFLYCFGIDSSIEGSKNTTVRIITLDGYNEASSYDSVKLGEKLVGWKHFDVTRDESGNSKIFVDGELILQDKVEISFSPKRLFIYTNVKGPAIDNVVVRNQVIDIQATE